MHCCVLRDSRGSTHDPRGVARILQIRCLAAAPPWLPPGQSTPMQTCVKNRSCRPSFCSSESESQRAAVADLAGASVYGGHVAGTLTVDNGAALSHSASFAVEYVSSGLVSAIKIKCDTCRFCVRNTAFPVTTAVQPTRVGHVKSAISQLYIKSSCVMWLFLACTVLKQAEF